MGAAIEIEQVSKRYRLGERGSTYATLRDAVSASVTRPLRRRQIARDEIWALRDVDLTVAEGEVIGVVGRNGAGKSTLLKVLSRITAPSAGVSRTRGRVGALLEVGTGFHPELTGRENVYLNGTILGMSRRDVARRFDEIVAFADVDRFLDTPLKRYSSGMYLRLAFAVAAHLEPEILIVDEVLAVGDAEFQEKCLGRMTQFGNEGRTVVFVSHDLGAINQLCERAVWFERGSIAADGGTRTVIDAYLSSVARRVSRVEFDLEPDKVVQLRSAALTDASGREGEIVRRDEAFAIRFVFHATDAIPGLDVGVRLLTRSGTAVIDEVWSDWQDRSSNPLLESGTFDVAMVVPPVLAAGDYVAYVWIGVRVGAEFYETFVDREAISFRLWPEASAGQEAVERARLVQAPVRWTFERPRPTRQPVEQ